MNPSDETPVEGALYVDSVGGPTIVIPSFEYPIDLPIVDRPYFASEELLDANGYDRSLDGWRGAMDEESDVLREAAVQLVAARGGPEDEDVLREALDDEAEIVRVWAAWGLVTRGDESARAVLEEVSRGQGDYGSNGPAIAASLLGALGHAEAWEQMLRHWNETTERRAILARVPRFVPLQGRTYARSGGSGSGTVDVWPLYRAALEDPDESTRYMALEHMAAYGDASLVPTLDAYIERSEPDWIQEKARVVRDRLAEKR